MRPREQRTENGRALTRPREQRTENREQSARQARDGRSEGRMMGRGTPREVESLGGEAAVLHLLNLLHLLNTRVLQSGKLMGLPLLRV